MIISHIDMVKFAKTNTQSYLLLTMRITEQIIQQRCPNVGNLLADFRLRCHAQNVVCAVTGVVCETDAVCVMCVVCVMWHVVYVMWHVVCVMWGAVCGVAIQRSVPATTNTHALRIKAS